MDVDRQASCYCARLAIAIPAYGRADTTALSLKLMAEEVRDNELDVIFVVSDDTPNDLLADAINKIPNLQRSVRYTRNSPSLGHDRNLISTLLSTKADYVWLLGSNFRVIRGQLSKVIGFLKGQDLVFINTHSSRTTSLPNVRGLDARGFLREMLWHQALTGTTIYGLNVIEWVKDSQSKDAIIPDFPQLSVLLGYMSIHDTTIGWFGEKSLEGAGAEDQSYWRSRAVSVFVDHWSAVIKKFPAIVSDSQRAETIREHSRQTDLFNTTNLLSLRKSGACNWSSLRSEDFRDAMHLPPWKLYAVLFLPITALELGSALLRKVKRLRCSVPAFGGSGRR